MENEEERKKNEEKEIDAKLIAVSNSIKAIGQMTDCGISYCIVDPGLGVREDARLASCCIAPPKDRPESALLQELAENICCMIQGFMNSMAAPHGYSDAAITGFMDHAYAVAKKRFLESRKGLGQGAGPQGGNDESEGSAETDDEG